MNFAIELAERGLVPLPGLRVGIRRLLRRRLGDLATGPDTAAVIARFADGPLAISVDEANAQHYELPPEFFELVLGPRLKYSGAYWPPGTRDLEEAETRMIDLTVERADLRDGDRILELGCGWGSLTLEMARRFPRSRITAVSNSAPQRAFILARAPANVDVITADVNRLALDGPFDRIVSVEMFEHLRNHGELFRRIRRWLADDGRLFVHVFCHRERAYPFEVEGSDDWMARHFFTGGIMPSFDFFERHEGDLTQEAAWAVDGTHYERTARAWRVNLEERRDLVLPVLERAYGADAERWYHRWRLFFLACEELFGYRAGREWLVGHYRFRPAAGPTGMGSGSEPVPVR